MQQTTIKKMIQERDCSRCRKDITYDPHIYYDKVSGEIAVCKKCFKILEEGK